jgi:hypothetical protein
VELSWCHAREQDRIVPLHTNTGVVALGNFTDVLYGLRRVNDGLF